MISISAPMDHLNQAIDMPSPCIYPKPCEFKDQDKNKEPCYSCEKKVAYAIKEEMLPPQVDVDMERKAKLIKEIEIPKKKEKTKIWKKKGRPRKTSLNTCKIGYVPLKFKDKHVRTYRALLRIAEKEERTINMQAIYFIKEGIERYKEDK